MRFGLPGHGVLAPRLDTMRRFAALIRTRRFPHSLFAPPRHAVWWTQALTAFDAAERGLPRREIAVQLFGAEAAAQHWPAESEWMRSRVRRAMQMGEKLADGGYRGILIRPVRDYALLSRHRYPIRQSGTNGHSPDGAEPLTSKRMTERPANCIALAPILGSWGARRDLWNFGESRLLLLGF